MYQVNDLSIDNTKIADDAVNTAKITNATIISEDLATDAITTDKIVDANVTPIKIESGAIGDFYPRTTQEMCSGPLYHLRLPIRRQLM